MRNIMILHFSFKQPLKTSLHFWTEARKNGLFVSIWHKPYGPLDRFYRFDRFSWFSFSFHRFKYTVTRVVNGARSLLAWRYSDSRVHRLNCCWFWGCCQTTKTTKDWSLCFILCRNKNTIMFHLLFVIVIGHSSRSFSGPIRWDRTSAWKGAHGCRYQSIFDLTHPPNPCIER